MKNYFLKISVVFALLCAASITMSAQEPVADVEFGPWVTNVDDGGFNVLWTSSFRTLSWVEVAPEDGTDFDSCERPRFYQTVSGRRVIDTFHNVRVSGLEPGTRYRYRVMSKVVLNDDSAYHTDYGPVLQMPVEGESAIRTFDTEADECTFVMLNDMHADDDKLIDLTADLTGDNVDFMVFNGDMMSYINDVDDMMAHVFAPIPSKVSSIPTFYTRGNHETRGRWGYLFQKYNPTSSGDTYFMLRHGPVAVLVMDAGEDKPDDNKEYSGAVDFDAFRAEELAWLKKAVKDPLFAKAPVKVAVMHIPPFNSEESWYGEKKAHELFVPVLNKAGLDIMFCAHYHEYIYAEEGLYDNKFPIIANDNDSRLVFNAVGKAFTVEIYDRKGNLSHSHEVEK